MRHGPLITRERVWTWAILTVLLSLGTAYRGEGWELGFGVGVFLAVCAVGLAALFRRIDRARPG